MDFDIAGKPFRGHKVLFADLNGRGALIGTESAHLTNEGSMADLTPEETCRCYMRVYYIGSVQDNTTNSRVLKGLQTNQLVWAWFVLTLLVYTEMLRLAGYSVRQEAKPFGHYEALKLQLYSSWILLAALLISVARIINLSITEVACSPITFSQLVTTGLNPRGARKRIAVECVVLALGWVGICAHCLCDYTLGSIALDHRECSEAEGSVALGHIIAYGSAVSGGDIQALETWRRRWYAMCNNLHVLGPGEESYNVANTELHAQLEYFSKNIPWVCSLSFHEEAVLEKMITCGLSSYRKNFERDLFPINATDEQKAIIVSSIYEMWNMLTLTTVRVIGYALNEAASIACGGVFSKKARALTSSSQMLGFMWENTKPRTNLQYKIQMNKPHWDAYEDCVLHIICGKQSESTPGSYLQNTCNLFRTMLGSDATLEDSLFITLSYIMLSNIKEVSHCGSMHEIEHNAFAVASDMVATAAISIGVCLRSWKEDPQRVRFYTGAVTNTRDMLIGVASQYEDSYKYIFSFIADNYREEKD